MENSALYATIGSYIANKRSVLGMTQGELAKKVGISRPSLANMERGKQVIALHHLYSLTNALDCKSITELLPKRLDGAGSVSLNHGTGRVIRINSRDGLSDELQSVVEKARAQLLSTPS